MNAHTEKNQIKLFRDPLDPRELSLSHTTTGSYANNETGGTRKLIFGKWGLNENPRGLQCVMTWKSRQLLGDIIDAKYDSVLGQTLLTVRHFNGEPWPIKPAAMAVDILIRDYEL